MRPALVVAVALAAAGVQAEQRSHTVRIEGMKFVPERLVVAVGDTVTWVNRDFVPHDVTAVDSSLASGDISAEGRWTLELREKGALEYFCGLHPVMRGVVVAR